MARLLRAFFLRDAKAMKILFLFLKINPVTLILNHNAPSIFALRQLVHTIFVIL